MNAIVCVDEGWGIGCRERLLVHISEDLKRFRSLTTGGTVVFGRNTQKTFPGGAPLKNRENWLLSTTAAPAPGLRVFRSTAELGRALTLRGGAGDVWLVGGAMAYRALLDRCSRVYVTRVFARMPADAFFPNLDEDPGWAAAESGPVRTDPSGLRYQYLTYENRRPWAVFDLDGTLWDATAQIFPAWQRVLAGQGRSLDMDRFRGYMGKTVAQLAALALPDLDPAQGRAVVDRCCREELDDLKKTPGLLYPGVRPMLEELHQTHRLGIVSNSQDGYVQTFLDTLGLWDLFSDVEMHGRTGGSKGQNLAALLARNGAAEGVYIGDTQGDRDAAREAGAAFVRAAYGFGSDPGAANQIQTPAELPALLQALATGRKL